MKVPKSIFIKGAEYTIECSEDLDHDVAGNTNEHTKTIQYCSSLKGKALKTCILHEIGHAIQFETGISQALNGPMQEVITENFSTVFDDLFHWRFR